MRKYFFICMVFCLSISSLIFVGCVADYDIDGQVTAPIKIGDDEYTSLAEAIAKANDGDAILVFDDVIENRDNKHVKALSSAALGDDVYVAYEINKPIVIKGVSADGGKPQINGCFLVNLGDEKYKDNSVTIDNLEIKHGYMSTVDDSVNQNFMVGIRVLDGSVNVVNNNIHAIAHIDDETILENDLSLTYGLMMSRPRESKVSGETMHYDIKGNVFGEYKNTKDWSFASPFLIVENFEDLGDFSPSIVNTKSNNFATEIFNENEFDEDNSIYAADYDHDQILFNSLAVNDDFDIDFSQLKSKKCRFIFNGDFKSNNVINVDVYGIMVFSGSVENVIFNLKDKDAKVVILGEMIGETQINKF